MEGLLSVSLGSVAFYGAAATVVAAILIVGLGISLHVDLRFGALYVPLVIFLVTIAPTIAILIGSRDVTTLEFERYSRIPQSAVWFLRLCSLTLVGLTVMRLGSHMLRSKSSTLRGPGSLLLAFIAFAVGNYLLNSAFGTIPSPPIAAAVYASFALMAVYASRQPEIGPALLSAKLALLFIMLASIALLALQPGLVRQVEGAEIRIPGLGFRLFGLAANPNSLATLAVVNLLITFYRRLRPGIIEALNVAATLAVLILAQSQTAWLAALVSVPVLLLGRSQVQLLGRRTLALSFVALALIGAAAIYASSRFGTHLSLSDFATGDRYRELVTLTGRLAIWDVAIREWQDNPLFGYGPSIWDSDYRARIGMNYAFTAHNQFLQTLSAAGMVGLVTTVIYTFVLGYLSFKAPRPERGLALSLFVLIAARLFTETPLQISSPFSNEFVPHLLLFTVLVFAHTRRGEMQRVPASRLSAPGAGFPMSRSVPAETVSSSVSGFRHDGARA